MYRGVFLAISCHRGRQPIKGEKRFNTSPFSIILPIYIEFHYDIIPVGPNRTTFRLTLSAESRIKFQVRCYAYVDLLLGGLGCPCNVDILGRVKTRAREVFVSPIRRQLLLQIFMYGKLVRSEGLDIYITVTDARTFHLKRCLLTFPAQTYLPF